MQLTSPAALLPLLLAIAPSAHAAGESRLATLAALDLRDGEFTQLDLPADLPAEVVLDFTLGGTPATLTLRRHAVRAASFRLLVDRGGVLTEEPAPAPRTYRGELWRPGSAPARVAASLTDDGLIASVGGPAGIVYGIAPLRQVSPAADRSEHVIYRQLDSASPAGLCGNPQQEGAGAPDERGGTPWFGSVHQITEIAFDADVEFYNANGSSVTNTTADIENVLNGVELIYENDVNTTYALTAVIVRTTEPDPYTTTVPGSLLDEFRSVWNANHKDIPRDVAHLMTGRNLDGSVIGIAQLGVVCAKTAAYGLSQSRYTTNFTNRIALTAHELGHNWGSPHCSGSGCFIMCPSLGGCGPVTLFGDFAKNAINTYKAGIGCLEVNNLPLPIPFADSFAGPTLEKSYWTGNGSNVAVLSDALAEPTAPYSLRLQSSGSAAGSQGQVVSATIALTGQTGATLSYQSEHRGVESGKSLVLEYLSTGLVWTELDRVISNGVDQSAFVPHQSTLPANALHDQFQFRFRVEGTATSDDWFVDDVTIGPPPPGPPSISSINPGQVEILFGDFTTVTGSGFNSPGLTVTVGGTPLIPYFEYFVIDDTTMTLKPPTGTALGMTDVVISNVVSTSQPFPLTLVPTDPPRLLGPLFVINSQTLTLSWGGTPGDLAFLLVAPSLTTLPFNGQSLLNFLFLVPQPALGANGLGQIQVPINVPSAVTIYAQLLTVPAPGINAAAAKVSNIVTLAIIG